MPRSFKFFLLKERSKEKLTCHAWATKTRIKMASITQIIDCTRSESHSSEDDTIIHCNFHDNKLYVCQAAGWQCVTGTTSSDSVPLGRMLDIRIVEGGFKVDNVSRVCSTLEEVQEALLQLGEGPSKKRSMDAPTKRAPRKKIKPNAVQVDDMRKEGMQALARQTQQFYVDKLYAAKGVAFPDTESMNLFQLAYQLYMGGR